jgi:hypothetical protein
MISPSDSFRVSIITPQGYQHARCFLEVALLIKSALNSLGFDCDMAVNEVNPQRINILLGYHFLTLTPALQQMRYIPYQLEQLGDEQGTFSEKKHQLLSHACAVWDYSEDNIAFLAARGIGARYLPLGYHPALERITPVAKPDIDVLFYGSLGGRRAPLVEALQADAGLAAEMVFGSYAQERDELIGRARIVLNVHFYPTRIYESVRLSYLFNNRCFVLSEHSCLNPYPEVELVEVEYEQLQEQCHYFKAHPQLCAERAALTYEQFKSHYPMERLLEKVV